MTSDEQNPAINRQAVFGENFKYPEKPAERGSESCRRPPCSNETIPRHRILGGWFGGHWARWAGQLEIGPNRPRSAIGAALVSWWWPLALSRTAAPAFDWVARSAQRPGESDRASFLVLCLCCFAATAIGLEAAPGRLRRWLES